MTLDNRFSPIEHKLQQITEVVSYYYWRHGPLYVKV